ncbi:hypothetical protein PCC6912_02680 [Chlorogloeopsis fritschii PCC 6912]|uniref:Uncharacterized protein n=1 Tax=Chlorogloeopsis fritschii PCC 6912 TaxID=211165 RepID=A0A433NRG7_CHLFR|nr:hypothetical protein [Chlorogloeopsis fritschii]RUR86825.1 hypothetical protein PCC6912_02680 [Chlorogloeopsis fritschii PCC 6912]
MNKERKISASPSSHGFRVSYVRSVCLGLLTTLAVTFSVTTSISVNRVSAANVTKESSALKKWIAKAKQRQNIRITKDTNLIAQLTSPGVGDSLRELNQLRQELLIDPVVIETRRVIAPSSTAGTPSAYGASWGQAYIGGGLYLPFDNDRIDGSAAVGFGLGDAIKSVGVEINANITSVGGGDNFDFGDSGGIGFKLHKYFSDRTAVAVGWSNPIKWGDNNGTKDTIYGVITKTFDLEPNNPKNKLPITLSAGVGSGIFRSKGAIAADENTPNFFGSVGLRVIPEVSLVTSWTGNSLNIGASYAPFKKTPIVINTILTDLTDNFDKGTGLSVSAGYVFQF